MSPNLRVVVVVIGALGASCTTPNPAFKNARKDSGQRGDGPAVRDASVGADGSGCIPRCAGRECGSDGCGGQCGLCPQGMTCDWNGRCEASCKPRCEDRQCGPDGCGGSCGVCTPPLACDEVAGKCECAPSCLGKQCGPDGCGGTCGTCQDGKVCDDSGQCAGGGACGSIDAIGCCDGKILKYCGSDKTLKAEDCSLSPMCGWDFKHKYYNCGTFGVADPAGNYPKSCP